MNFHSIRCIMKLVVCFILFIIYIPVKHTTRFIIMIIHRMEWKFIWDHIDMEISPMRFFSLHQTRIFLKRRERSITFLNLFYGYTCTWSNRNNLLEHEEYLSWDGKIYCPVCSFTRSGMFRVCTSCFCSLPVHTERVAMVIANKNKTATRVVCTKKDPPSVQDQIWFAYIS